MPATIPMHASPHSTIARINKNATCTPSRRAARSASLSSTTTCDKICNARVPNWGRKFFRHHFHENFFFTPTYILGMARTHDFLSQNCFFTKITALIPGFAYFPYNSNIYRLLFCLEIVKYMFRNYFLFLVSRLHREIKF